MTTHFEDKISKEASANFFNFQTESDSQFVNFQKIQRGKDERGTPIVFNFKQTPQFSSRFEYCKYSFDQTIQRPFKQGQQTTCKIEKIPGIAQKFYLKLSIQNTHATDVANLPKSISYLMKNLGIYVDSNRVGDEIPSEVTNFYNYIDLEIQNDVATQKTLRGISSSAITLAVGETKTWFIYLPFFFNMQFYRNFIQSDMFLKFNFVNNVPTNQGGAGLTITQQDLLITCCELYVNYVSITTPLQTKILSNSFMDYKYCVPIFTTQKFDSISSTLNYYELKLTSYKSLTGFILVWATEQTDDLSKIMDYYELSQAIICTNQDTNINSNIENDQLMVQQIVSNHFGNNNLFMDFKNKILVLNYSLDPKQFVTNHIFSGGQDFKDQDYKIKVKFAQTHNNQVQLNVILFTYGYYDIKPKKIDLKLT